jgi:hypothetical protein
VIQVHIRKLGEVLLLFLRLIWEQQHKISLFPFSLTLFTAHPQQVDTRARTLAKLRESLRQMWEDLGISPDDSPLDRTDSLTLERITEYERLIEEAQALMV